MLSVEASDDAGAETYDRFDWQVAMAAADGLRLYLDCLDDGGRVPADCPTYILCEKHEDWVAIDGPDAELVSAKHREPSKSVFTTVRQLVTEGGLAHMFTQWCTLDERPTCRLVTSGGLKAGDAQQLGNATQALSGQRRDGLGLQVDGDHSATIESFANLLWEYPDRLPAVWRDRVTSGEPGPGLKDHEQVARFLATLTIDHGRPMRSVTRAAAPNLYIRPILRRLGFDTPADELWEAVHTLFRARMRASGDTPSGALPQVLRNRASGGPSSINDLERAHAARIVTVSDIEIAIQIAIDNPGAFRRTTTARKTSRTAIKMSIGRCSVNSIERAEQLRLDYQKHWRVRIADDPTARLERDRLRRRLLRISDEATSAIGPPAEPWGADLWAELGARVDAIPDMQRPLGFDADLLLGGLADLTDLCQVWFSPEFDIEAEIERRRTSRAA